MEDFFTPETFSLVVGYAVKAIGFIVVLVVARIVAGWVRKLIRTGLDRPQFDKTLTKFLGNFAYYGIILLGVVVALSTLGIAAASLAAVLAAVGFAVGLALQGTLGNFAAGVMLLIFRPFSVGDYVEIADETGFVREIQLFFTRIDTHSNQLVIVPNGDIFDSKIRNLFNYDVVRVDCAVGTDYPADIDQTREVLLEAARRVEDRVEEEGEQAALLGLGDSAISWEVRIWARTDDYFRLKQELTRSVKYALDDAGIGIPYPQMDVHVDQLEPEPAGNGAP